MTSNIAEMVCAEAVTHTITICPANRLVKHLKNHLYSWPVNETAQNSP